MTFGGLGGPGSAPGPFHGELARSQVQHARAGAPRLPDDVIAAAREERALRRLRRRVGRWQRLRRIR
jgi:hypothetical protein